MKILIALLLGVFIFSAGVAEAHVQKRKQCGVNEHLSSQFWQNGKHRHCVLNPPPPPEPEPKPEPEPVHITSGEIVWCTPTRTTWCRQPVVSKERQIQLIKMEILNLMQRIIMLLQQEIRNL